MKKISSVKILIGVFNAICLAVAIALIVYWTYQFSLNKDVSSIDYKRYHDSELDKYPLLSICFKDFLSKTKLQEQNNRTKVSEYVSFLKGKKFQPRLLEIDFKNVTKNISEYIKYFLVDGSGVKEYPADKNLLSLSFVGKWRRHFLTCYSLNTPQNSPFRLIALYLNRTIFPNGIRDPVKGLFSIFHYPNQILMPGNPMKNVWDKRGRKDKFIMRYDVDNVAIIMRRNKPQQPCNENWKHYDNEILENYVKSNRCRLPFQNVNTKLPLCNTSQAIKAAWINSPALLQAQNDQPCKSMIKISYRFDEFIIKDRKHRYDDLFILRLAFHNPFFREITLER